MQVSEVTGNWSGEGKSLLDQGPAHIQSSVEVDSKGACMWPLRAEHWARVSRAHCIGHGGQELSPGFGGAWITEVFGSLVEFVLHFEGSRSCQECFKPGRSSVIRFAYSVPHSGGTARSRNQGLGERGSAAL